MHKSSHHTNQHLGQNQGRNFGQNKDPDNDCFLISIEAVNRDGLFDCYRDYLVFMSLVRDGVRACQFKVNGFCWLKNHGLLLIQPEVGNLGHSLLRLLKRYHYWLMQRGPEMTEFKLQMLKLSESSAVLDCLRFLHQQAVHTKVVNDAMDYHWHSYHVYNGFWSVKWLDVEFIMKKFSDNRLVAMNRFRQYMLHHHRLNFNRMLLLNDCSNEIVGKAKRDFEHQRSVAEVNSHYHQSLDEKTIMTCINTEQGQLIRIRVAEKNTQRAYSSAQ